MLFPTLWEFRTLIKTSIGFTLFPLVHGVEAVLPIEFQIPTLQSSMELLPNTSAPKQQLFTLEHLNEECK